MKTATFLLAATGLMFLSLKSYSQKLAFSYDAAGNQTGRAWVCVGCVNPLASAAPGHSPITLETQGMDNLTGTPFKRTVIASPNPLRETLHLNWQAEKDIYVKSIAVFTINGVRTHHTKPSPNLNSTTLPFGRLAPGTYVLYITFSDQKTETIKVIKN